jgi:hypothetical protein
LQEKQHHFYFVASPSKFLITIYYIEGNSYRWRKVHRPRIHGFKELLFVKTQKH